MTAYVTDPMATIPIILDKTQPIKQRIHCGLGLLDYGVVTVLPDVAPIPATKGCPDKTEDELLEEIHKCCTMHGTPDATSVGPLIQLLLPLVLQLISKWL